MDDNLIDLVDKMLVYNPTKRLSVEECLKHPFFHSSPMADSDEMPKFEDEYKNMATRK